MAVCASLCSTPGLLEGKQKSWLWAQPQPWSVSKWKVLASVSQSYGQVDR